MYGCGIVGLWGDVVWWELNFGVFSLCYFIEVDDSECDGGDVFGCVKGKCVLDVGCGVI